MPGSKAGSPWFTPLSIPLSHASSSMNCTSGRFSKPSNITFCWRIFPWRAIGIEKKQGSITPHNHQPTIVPGSYLHCLMLEVTKTHILMINKHACWVITAIDSNNFQLASIIQGVKHPYDCTNQQDIYHWSLISHITRIKRMFDDEILCLMIIFQCLMAKSLFLPNHCAIVCSCTASVKWAMKIPKKIVNFLDVFHPRFGGFL